MHPILFKVGAFTLYSYGLMVAIGFGLAVYLASATAPSHGIKKENVIDMALCILIAGLVGARFLYVILNIDYYLARPMEVFYISQGGLVYYGAFLSGLLASVICAFRMKVSFWKMADLFAPYIALAQAIGRVGCFLNGCCYGRGQHPVQIYASLALFLIFLMLLLIQRRRRFAGEAFLSYCVLYSAKRFFMEFLRGDNPRILFGLTVSQAISLLLFAGAVFAYAVFFKRWKKNIRL